MAHDYHMRKATTGRYRFRDVSHMKPTYIFKPLGRQRLCRDAAQRSPLAVSQNLPSSHVGHALLGQHPSPNRFSSPSTYYRSGAISVLSAMGEACSSGMSTSFGLERNPNVWRTRYAPPRPTFSTSPSMFHLRSRSTKDYQVDRLEQHLRQLALADASPDHAMVSKSSSSRDISIDVCLDMSFLQPIGQERSPSRALPDGSAHERVSSPHDRNIVPMILITSVDAKHAKPLPLSTRQPSRTPFSPSNVINHATNTRPAESKPKTLSDDPFTTLHDPAYPPDYNLTFRLPCFPSTYPTPSKYAPETPTPMYCDHFGDCRGDLWEVLHPPLVAGRFALPPFKLPPLSTGLFNDTSAVLSQEI